MIEQHQHADHGNLQTNKEWYVWSETVGAKITASNVFDVVPEDDLGDVYGEVLAELQKAKAALTDAIVARGSYYVPTHIHRRLVRRKAGVSAIAVRIQRKLSEINESKKNERIRVTAEIESIFPFGRYFQRVVKREASSVDYQRWILQAKQMQQSDIDRGEVRRHV